MRNKYRISQKNHFKFAKKPLQIRKKTTSNSPKNHLKFAKKPSLQQVPILIILPNEKFGFFPLELELRCEHGQQGSPLRARVGAPPADSQYVTTPQRWCQPSQPSDRLVRSHMPRGTRARPGAPTASNDEVVAPEIVARHVVGSANDAGGGVTGGDAGGGGVVGGDSLLALTLAGSTVANESPADDSLVVTRRSGQERVKQAKRELVTAMLSVPQRFPAPAGPGVPFAAETLSDVARVVAVLAAGGPLETGLHVKHIMVHPPTSAAEHVVSE
jgi:hypothetical protein